LADLFELYDDARTCNFKLIYKYFYSFTQSTL
jgi:hypothetical protein